MRLLPTLYFLLFGLGVIPAGYCQPSFHYSPANYSAKGAPVQQYLAEAHQKEIAALPKRYRSELEKIYKDRHEHLAGSLREEQFIFSPQYTGYFDGVLAEIRRANPQLNSQSVHLLVSRDPTPNATCLGNGIITFTIGLLRRVENESQVAFVLCHELAHQHLGHVQQSIQQYVEKQNNPNTRREIERIAASENRRVEQATGLLRSMVYEHTRYSRVHETAADSLALVYLKNTRYNPQESLRVLALLDTVDRSKYPGPLDLKPVFDSPGYPFKDAWLQASPMMKIEGKKDGDWNEDSLKTHPDCTRRITLLKNQLGAGMGPGKENFLQPFALLAGLVRQSDFELVQSEFDARRYAQCLQESLLLLRQYPENVYLHATIGKCFYHLYKAQQQHELGKYVPLPSARHSPMHRQMVDFIHNLRLREIGAVGYYFLKKNQATHASDEDFLYALTQLSNLVEPGPGAKTLQDDYLRRFPDGKYAQDIKSIH